MTHVWYQIHHAHSDNQAVWRHENGGVSIMGIGLLVDETWPVETEETGFYYRPLYNTKIKDE